MREWYIYQNMHRSPSFCALLLKNSTKPLTDVTSRSTGYFPQCSNGMINRGKYKFLCWDLNIKHCSSEIKCLWVPREVYRLLCLLAQNEVCLEFCLKVVQIYGESRPTTEEYFHFQIKSKTGHSEFRHGQWEAKVFSFCDNEYVQSPFCQSLEIKSLPLKHSASDPALGKGRRVFRHCSTLFNSFSIIGMLMSPAAISMLETNRVI